MKRVKVAAGYKCPLCADHQDDEFWESALFETPICLGCSIELHHFAEEDPPRQDKVIDRTVRLVGRSWSGCRIVLMRESLDWLEREHRRYESLTDDGRQSLGPRDQQFLSNLPDQVRELREKLDSAMLDGA